MPSDKVYTDQLGRQVTVSEMPMRIVSLVPSQTELLFDLGLDNRIAGITKYCTHPAEQVQYKAKVGGTKQLDINLIKSLQPDLIIANKEENERADVEELMQHFPVWISDIRNLEDALKMISGIGQITGRQSVAEAIVSNITSSFNNLNGLTTKLKVAYFIWRKPYMLAGKDTFISNMLQSCGLVNAVESNRYPEFDIESLIDINPDVMLFSSEPYPFKQKHIDELKLFLSGTKMYLVDGEMFSWYGSRLKYSSSYFQQLINKIENIKE